MAKKRAMKDLKKEEQAEEEIPEKPLGVKQWAIKTGMLFVIFVFLIYLTGIYFKVDLLSNTLIAIGIALFVGLIHEYLHYHQAKKLGYKITWYRTTFTMGFEVSHNKTEQWKKDKKKISLLPYYVLLPASIIIFLIGITLSIWGIWVGGVMGILLHTIAYPLTEGH